MLGGCGKNASRTSIIYGIREDGSEWAHTKDMCYECWLMCDQGLYTITCKECDTKFYMNYGTLPCEDEHIYCPKCKKEIKHE